MPPTSWKQKLATRMTSAGSYRQTSTYSTDHIAYIVYSTHINWSIQCTHAESFVFLISNWQYRLRCSWRCKGRCRSRCRYKMHLLLQILQILVAVAVAYPLGGSSLAATRQLVRLSAHSSALTHESLLTINWHFDWRRLSFKGGVQLQQQQQQQPQRRHATKVKQSRKPSWLFKRATGAVHVSRNTLQH